MFCRVRGAILMFFDVEHKKAKKKTIVFYMKNETPTAPKDRKVLLFSLGGRFGFRHGAGAAAESSRKNK